MKIINVKDIGGLEVDKNMDGKMKLGYFQCLDKVLSLATEIDEEIRKAIWINWNGLWNEESGEAMKQAILKALEKE